MQGPYTGISKELVYCTPVLAANVLKAFAVFCVRIVA